MVSASIQPGTLFNGRYRVVRLLNHGGMGSVYAAADIRLGRNVALKVARPTVAADAQTRQRFLREAQIAAQVVHPNVVRTYDAGDSPYGPYLVQELLDGHTLEQEIPQSPQRTLQVALAVAGALEYVHGRGYVHCDIKPSNIMVSQQDGRERIVLLDFGIARTAGAAETTLLATPHYLAPERILGAAPSPASDLYALGITLYELSSGRLPFNGQTMGSIVNGHLYGALPPLAATVAHTSAIQAIIDKLTAKEPTARYASAAALRADLQAAWTRMLGTQVLHKQHTTTPLTASRHRRWLWALPLPLTAICLVAALIGARSSTPDAGVQARTAQVEASAQVGNGITVPDVVGIPLEDALRRLAQAGLTGAARASVPSDKPPGTVVQTVPDEGQPLPPGAQVTVHTSAGPAAGSASTPVNVPDVRGLSLDDARRRLEQAGFAFVTGEQVPNDQPAGTVIATVPNAAQPLSRGMQVVVHASAGPVVDTASTSVAVPNVVGLLLPAARRQIEQANLVCVVDVLVPSEQPAGTVVSVLPAPGTQLPPGTRVVVHASAGPATHPAAPTVPVAPTAVPARPTRVPTATPFAPVGAPAGPTPPVTAPSTPQPTQPQPVQPTNTPVSPTATSVPPTSVPTPSPPPDVVPSTPQPQPTQPQPVPEPPTSTPVPEVPTDTPAPLPTDTPAPVAPTDTPAPLPTDTPVPPATPTPEDEDDAATPTATGDDDDDERNDGWGDNGVTPPARNDDERITSIASVSDEDDQ